MDTAIAVALITGACSSGVTGLITAFMQKGDAKNKVLKGLAHDRIIALGQEYLERGYITKDEYENLHDYLFVPYQKIGGNGTAEKMMKEVDKLPIKERHEKTA